MRRKWTSTWGKKPRVEKIASIRGKKPHVYRVIILKQMADHIPAFNFAVCVTNFVAASFH